MKKNSFLLFLLGALACKNSKTNLSIDLGGNGGKGGNATSGKNGTNGVNGKSGINFKSKKGSLSN